MAAPEHVKQATRGAPLRTGITANIWNRLVRGITRTDKLENADPEPFRSILPDRDTLAVFNKSASTDRGQFEPLVIDATRFTNADNLAFFRERLYLQGDAPDSVNLDQTWGITAEPIPKEQPGRVRVAGFTQAKIKIDDEDHEFATIESGVDTKLVSDPDVGARIVWKESGTGPDKWSIVDLSDKRYPLIATYRNAVFQVFDFTAITVQFDTVMKELGINTWSLSTSGSDEGELTVLRTRRFKIKYKLSVRVAGSPSTSLNEWIGFIEHFDGSSWVELPRSHVRGALTKDNGDGETRMGFISIDAKKGEKFRVRVIQELGNNDLLVSGPTGMLEDPFGSILEVEAVNS